MSARRTSIVALLMAIACVLAPVCTRAAEAPELQVRAAFLFNLARFVDWPPDKLPDPDSPITICVLGEPEFAEVVRQTIQGKSVGSHALTAREPGKANELAGCHIAYFGDEISLQTTLAATGGHHVLTVHDAPAAQAEGVVRLFLEQRRIRFEVNTAAATREQLQLSSKLLSLARLVAL